MIAQKVAVRPDPDTLAALEEVAFVYPNGVVALAGLELRVAAGSFTCLVGPSGCGKTTALRLLAGLLAPSRGRIRRSMRGPGEVALVFQDPTLLPWASVRDNVELPLRLRRIARREARREVERALDLVGLGEVADAYPHELSGGMRMRVSLARALVSRPKLMLLDEPFAALDEITRFRLDDELLTAWGSQGWGVVFVTHSVFESVYLGQQVLVMTPRPGRIAARIAVPEPYPRTPAFRASERYLRLCSRVSEALERAADASA